MSISSSSVPVDVEPSGAAHYRPYTLYKDAGLELLDEIPAHWAVERLKYVSTLNDEVLPESTDPNLTMAYIDISNVDAVQGITGSETFSFEESPSRARRVIRHGDVIVSTVRTYLRAIAPIHDPPQNTIVSTGFAVIRPNGIHSKFASYALRSAYFVERVVADSVGVSFPAINAADLVSLPIVLPNLGEQRAIAAFLDRETAKIDALVAKKERLIELLQEKRTALITHAVTKGLDPNVPMKDSGVKWFGPVPAHWNSNRVRDLAVSLQTGPFGTQLHADDYMTGGVPVINPANLVNTDLVPDSKRTVDEVTAARLGDHRLSAGDILFARRGEVGRLGLVSNQQEGWLCGTGCLRMRPAGSSASSPFLLYAFSTRRVRDWLQMVSVGSTMDNLNTSIIGRIPLAIPPIDEQRSITENLDQELEIIFNLVAKVQEAIDRLKELRAAIISAAVTGKIDVRETAA